MFLQLKTKNILVRKAIKEKEEAAVREAERDLANTNQAKFIKNVESRIYAQLSKQLVDSMFGENSNESGTVTFEGTTISYVKDTDNVRINNIGYKWKRNSYYSSYW